MRAELTDREAALIVRALRMEAGRLRIAANEIMCVDGADYGQGGAVDAVMALHLEIGKLSQRLNEAKMRAGGAAS